MGDWREKLCSTKNVKILESESSSSEEHKNQKINLEKYEKAHRYFKNKTALTEVRSDISSRFGYLEYFIHTKGNIPRDDPDDYCCKIIENETFDELMTIVLSVSFDRNKYSNQWKCSNKIDITNFTNEIEIREWVISGRCKICQDHAFTSKSLKEHQGNIIYDSFICHGIQGKPPNISYDLFYTYLTRISKIEQLEMCNDKSCLCIPKVILPENVFKINIIFDKDPDAKKENKHKKKLKKKYCYCGSKKRMDKCCGLQPDPVSSELFLGSAQSSLANDKPKDSKLFNKKSTRAHPEEISQMKNSLAQASISNHILKQMDIVKPNNNNDEFMSNVDNIFKINV